MESILISEVLKYRDMPNKQKEFWLMELNLFAELILNFGI